MDWVNKIFTLQKAMIFLIVALFILGFTIIVSSLYSVYASLHSPEYWHQLERSTVCRELQVTECGVTLKTCHDDYDRYCLTNAKIKTIEAKNGKDTK